MGMNLNSNANKRKDGLKFGNVEYFCLLICGAGIQQQIGIAVEIGFVQLVGELLIVLDKVREGLDELRRVEGLLGLRVAVVGRIEHGRRH